MTPGSITPTETCWFWGLPEEESNGPYCSPRGPPSMRLGGEDPGFVQTPVVGVGHGKTPASLPSPLPALWKVPDWRPQERDHVGQEGSLHSQVARLPGEEGGLPLEGPISSHTL